MEMESTESDQVGDHLKEASIKDLSDSDASTSHEFPDQQVIPRVGEKYQVQIPFMTLEMMESERLKLLPNPADSQIANGSRSFLMGLPILITWVKEVNGVEAKALESPTIDPVKKTEMEVLDSPSNPDDAVNVNKSMEARKRKRNHNGSGKRGSELNASPLESGMGQGEDSRPTSLRALLLKERQLNQLKKSKSCSPVPDSFREPWSDAEVDSFLLGLYIFGKHFNQVTRFVEYKTVGEIMSFYYGIFYRSDEYCRWSDCKKNRRRKCIFGEKIFTGWRQRELLSRMTPHIREESQITLLEGYKSFTEGRTSLEEYVLFLKSTVGIHVLVEAVGIGKGEQDLTGFAIEPGKNNQETPSGPASKIPNGKAFASLPFTEIVKLLTGGLRLSKARCTDIFWEAVWPRLLANGWHSEQPKNRGYVSSDNYLVFLMPGIKKYSRRKLTKGEHYLDSVSDVLNKVASEPKLIELEADKDPVENVEGGWTQEPTSDQEDRPYRQRPCYLKPRASTKTPEHMKFTIVDTSLIHGGNSRGIVEQRRLPVETETTWKVSDSSTESETDSEGESSEDKPKQCQNGFAEMPLKSKKNKAKDGAASGAAVKKFTVVDTSLVFGGKSTTVRELRCLPAVDKSKCTSWEVVPNSYEDLPQKPMRKRKPNATGSSLNIDHHDDLSANAENTETHQDQKNSMSNNKLPQRSILSKSTQRAKSGHSNSTGPVIKRRKLTACVKAETRCLSEKCSQGLESEQLGLHGTLNGLSSGTLVAAIVGPKQKEPSITSVTEGSLEEKSSLETRSEDGLGMHTSQAHASSNLSQPQDLVDRTDGDTCGGAVSHETNADGSCLPFNGTELVDDTLETSKMNSRRQSTRKRPLTAKAMEAFANGYLGGKSRQKKDVGTRENSFSCPSRKSQRVRKRVKAPSCPADSVGGHVSVKEEMDVNEVCKVNTDMLTESLDQMGDKWLTSY